MSLLFNILEGGSNIPVANRLGRRFVFWLGRMVADSRPGVSIHKTCLIHPEARICARGKQLEIGAGSIIARGTAIQGAVSIGEGSSVQSNGNVVGYTGGEISIGNGVRIASNCMIIGGNHGFKAGAPIHEQALDVKPITIKDDVWIAGSVNIVAGVTIGEGSVVGAGSVVTKDIPPMSVAVGSPARVVKSRT